MEQVGARETPEQGRNRRTRGDQSRAKQGQRKMRGWSSSEECLRSRYSSVGTVAHWGTSSEHLSREIRSRERKGKTTQGPPFSVMSIVPSRSWSVVCREGTGDGAGKETFYRGKWYFPPVYILFISQYQNKYLKVYINCNKINSVKLPSTTPFSPHNTWITKESTETLIPNLK